MAGNDYVNKVELSDGSTLIDLTGDTATASDVVRGKSLHLASGAPVTGTLDVAGAISDSDIDSVVADEAPTGTDSLRLTGLSYLWSKLKAAFEGFLPLSGGKLSGDLSIGESTGITKIQVINNNTTVFEADVDKTTNTFTSGYGNGTLTVSTSTSSGVDNVLLDFYKGSNRLCAIGTGADKADVEQVSQLSDGTYDTYFAYVKPPTSDFTTYTEPTLVIELEYVEAIRLENDGDAWFAGEVSATEEVTEGGTTTTVTHNLTEKADADHTHTVLGNDNTKKIVVNANGVSECGSTASGNYSHAEGGNTTASGNYSHAEGNNTTASGQYSHAEGYSTTASRSYSHAEGYAARAQSINAHAEGHNTVAGGDSSHAEGTGSKASGNYSHAEGLWSEATHECSHAEGYYTKTGGVNQHVAGTCNIALDDMAEIIGNGIDSSNRSNARTLDWNGNAWHAGEVSATETRTEDGTTTTITHNLTEKITRTGDTMTGDLEFEHEVSDKLLVQAYNGSTLLYEFVTLGGQGDSPLYDTSLNEIGTCHAMYSASLGGSSLTISCVDHNENELCMIGTSGELMHAFFDVQEAEGTAYVDIDGTGYNDANVKLSYFGSTMETALEIKADGRILIKDEQMYPTFIRTGWSESSDETTLPVTPCFVLNPTDSAYYYCDDTAITRINDVNSISWPGTHNLTATATANNQEWSIDMTPGSYTGTYWQVWSSKNSRTVLACYADDNSVRIPNGDLRFSGSASIGYQGTQNYYQMIKFKDNADDVYGNGIVIGGGGLTIIGGGESASAVSGTFSYGGDERMIVANDGSVEIWSNCQNGASSAKTASFDTGGNLLLNKNGSLILQGDGSSSISYGVSGPKIEFRDGSATQRGQLIFTEYDAVDAGASLNFISNQSSSWLRSQYIRAWTAGYSPKWNTTSDKRLKEHIEYLNEESLGFIRLLRPVKFKMNDEIKWGFYAQDVQEICDEVDLVSENEGDGMLSLDYNQLIAPLVATVQKLTDRVEQLEAEIAELKA